MIRKKQIIKEILENPSDEVLGILSHQVKESEKVLETIKKGAKRRRIGLCIRFAVLSILFSLIITVAVAEILAGLISNSLTLLGDAFHMLGDTISWFIGIISVLVMFFSLGKRSNYFTFGYDRAEIIGSIFSVVFLLSLVIFIVVESIHKFTDPHPLEHAYVMLIVSICGICIDALGFFTMICGEIFLLRECFRGGKEDDIERLNIRSCDNQECCFLISQLSETKMWKELKGSKDKKSTVIEVAGEDENPDFEDDTTDSPTVRPTQKQACGILCFWNCLSPSNYFWKMSAYTKVQLIHVCGDTLGSAFSIILAILLIYYPIHQEIVTEHGDEVDHGADHHEEHLHLDCTENCWIMYLDPVFSLIQALVIFVASFPSFLNLSKLICETVPSSIKMKDLKVDLVGLKEVVEIREFRCWRLVEDRVFASLKVLVESENVKSSKEATLVANKIKLVFHCYGIHSSSVQLDFVQKKEIEDEQTDECGDASETLEMEEMEENETCSDENENEKKKN